MGLHFEEHYRLHGRNVRKKYYKVLVNFNYTWQTVNEI
jgi:hypothetical protein